MHAMDGLLMEGVPLNAVADAVGTPAWVVSAGHVRGQLAALRAALDGAGLRARIHYAVKANDHLAVLRLVAQAGAGADVVSGGELRRALLAGIPAAQVVFSGVGKAEWELRLALEEGVGQINAESAEELDMLSAIAASIGRTAHVALRINPDVDAGTHAKITTGRADNKFGIAYADAAALYARAATLNALMARMVAVSARHGHSSSSSGAWSIVARAPRIISPPSSAPAAPRPDPGTIARSPARSPRHRSG